MNPKRKKILLLVSVVAIALFILTTFFSIFESVKLEQLPKNPPAPAELIRLRPLIPVYSLFISLTLLTFAVIPISYYFISKKFEENLDKRLSIISKLLEKNSTKLSEKDGKEIVLKFLNPSEKKVVERLVEKKGEALQSEVSREEGMTKLKTHRAVRNLEAKGIVKRYLHGKTYRIVLSKDVKELLLE